MLPRFGWQAVLERWEFAPVVTAIVVVFAALYLWGAWRVGRRHPARPWPWWRTGLFLGGLLVVVLATESGIGAYDDVLFWDHMIQHLMLIIDRTAPAGAGPAGHAAAARQPEPGAHLGQAAGAVPGGYLPHVPALRAGPVRGDHRLTHLTGLMGVVMTNPRCTTRSMPCT